MTRNWTHTNTHINTQIHTHTHTHTHAHTRGKTHLNRRPVLRKGRYLRHTQQNIEIINDLCGIRTRDTSNKVPSHARLRPQDHLDR
jgi:hypothetical protein